MKTAKLETKRKDNSVNWRIMAEEFSQTEKLMGFERSVFIEKKIKPDGFDRLSFCDYAELCEFHSEISSSHRQQIIAKMIECKNDPYELERWLMIHGASELGKSFTDILEDEKLRSDRVLVTERIAKLFELLSIERNNNGK
ncbi:MAG: hypothetical protein GY749_18360 [Desulfobacteraceae bacterium]|nr:hypothetical protein [Desulfobacteraceae bacterium]